MASNEYANVGIGPPCYAPHLILCCISGHEFESNLVVHISVYIIPHDMDGQYAPGRDVVLE